MQCYFAQKFFKKFSLVLDVEFFEPQSSAEKQPVNWTYNF